MSKVNEIQQALLEMGGGDFQKLADAFLVEKGFGRVNSIGSVVAANKVKPGTPDALFATANGRYIFAEHTTQRLGLLDKMKEDLRKCFDENKTGVSLGKVERVVFCFTGRLDAKDENDLAEACQKEGVNLDLFGIDAISFDLYGKYPGLALDFLGIQIDTGQIVPPDRFISLYNKNKLATRLDLGFHSREEELSQLLDALESERLVVLSGRAGVGKSRLALEVCARFRGKHPEYEVMCIFGRNRDLWDDLQIRFRRPGNFLIFVDDANRVSRFEYVVDLLLHQRADQQIKVLTTVRDYAVSKVRDAARPLGGGAEVELGPFTDDQIKGLITEEYEIRNNHYLDRIADIAKGNARLAVMAAEVAKEGPLSSIYDVSGLYDTYFSSIRDDVSDEGADLGENDLLTVAAIVSLFKAVDRTSEEMMSSIEEAFGITAAAFWEAAERLHDLEVLDMHEDEVARVSDQILWTYLFYLAVFKDGALGFGTLINHFFPKLRHRLIDSISPILNAFDGERIIDIMRPYIEGTFLKLEEEGDSEGLLHLVDVFWFVSRTKTLLWARDRINELEAESVDGPDISFEKSTNPTPSPSILSVLRPFAFAAQEEARVALDLLLSYLGKRCSEVPFLLRVLIEDYGFRPDSYLRGFEIQRAVVDAVWKRAEDWNRLFSRLFLAVASDYLSTHFENYNLKDSRVFQVTRFDLPVTSELTSLREAIWEKLFNLYRSDSYKNHILELIRNYSSDHFRLTSSELVKLDAEHVLPFLELVLDHDEYRHCVVLHEYLDTLEMHRIDVPYGLRERFRNDTYDLAEVLLPEWSERQGLGLPYEEYEQYKRDRLTQQTSEYTLDDYARFFGHCCKIREALDEKRDGYKLQGGVEKALLSLADRDSCLYGQVMQLYLGLKDPLRLNAYLLVKKLVEHLGHNAALQLLCGPEYPTRACWLFHLHVVLPADTVDEKWLGRLYDLFATAGHADLPYGFDYLLKYLPLDSRVVTKVVGMIMEKVDHEPPFTNALTSLFNPHMEAVSKLSELFAQDLDLLKRVYLVVEATGHCDYDGKVFGQLIDLDPAFVSDYIASKYESTKKRWLSSHDDHRDYSFVWARADGNEIIDTVVDTTYAHEQKLLPSINPYLKKFFQIRVHIDHSTEEIQKIQDTYLLCKIDERSSDLDFIVYLFALISGFLPERRRLFVERFVRRNRNFKAFERLPLEPNSWSSGGSWVPVLQGRVEYWESLLPIMNSVELLQHKQYVERKIQCLHAQIECEKKKDFIRD